MTETSSLTRRRTPPASAMLLIYIVFVTGISCHWGLLSWWGLTLIVAAALLVVRYQLRPEWVGPSAESILGGIVIGSIAAHILVPAGFHQETVRCADATRMTAPGILIKVLTALSLLGACAYLTRRWAGRARLWFGALVGLAIAIRILMIFSSPAPRIDVFVSQTYAGQGLLNGFNIYAADGMPSPYAQGETFWHYAYPPIVVYCNCLSWLLFKDVRGMWVLCDLAAAGMLYLLARRNKSDNPVFAELLALAWLFMPRSLLVIEQSWTEPLASVTMAGFALALAAGRGPLATGAAFGLWLSSKQYVVLAVPLVARLRRLPVKAWGAAATLILLLALPFMIWNFQGLMNNLVIFFLKSEARPDANSIFGLVYGLTGWQIPWGVVLAFWLGALAWFTWRMPSTLSGMIFSTAGVWIFFFLVGKQAYTNYFYLISFALLLAVAANREDVSATVPGEAGARR